MKTTRSLTLFLLCILAGCTASRAPFSPARKFSPAELQKDYSVYQALLESHHPGLYWYTDKETMDQYFAWGAKQLHDSLTEPEFRKVLNFVTAKIDCGHTTVRPSKAWN